MLTAETKAAIQEELFTAHHKHKREVIFKWAKRLGKAEKTIRNYVRVAGRKERRDKGKRRDEKEKWAEIIFAIKKLPPEDAGELALDDAIEMALREGKVPKEAEDVSPSTYNRIAREKGWRKKRRIQRFEAEYPNHAHMVDASSSARFYVRDKRDGEYILGLHKPHKDYKNKPVPLGVRPWIYGIVDDYSRFRLARYVVAEGENMGDSLDFVCWAWSHKEGIPFKGVPERIVADQGKLMKGKAASDLLNRLNIKKMAGIPGQKERHGKIEAFWKTLWKRFELPFMAINNWQEYEITLTELNKRLIRFLMEEYNRWTHPTMKTKTKIGAWMEIIRRGGVLGLPEHALATTLEIIERTVDRAGILRLDNELYEVKGLHDEKVFVYRGIFDGRIVVECKRTGAKYEVEEYKPNTYDQYTAHPLSGDQLIRKQSAELSIVGEAHTENQRQDARGKMAEKTVTYFPVKEKEIAFDDPFDIGNFSDVEEAISYIARIVVIGLDEEQRGLLRELLSEEGHLNRDYVKDLALEMRSEAYKPRLRVINA